MDKEIRFNRPVILGNEIEYIKESILEGQISGNGKFTKKCHSYFEDKYGFKKCLLTTSCTDALEMAAILCEIKPGDEVIAPSYTFVSTVNAFILRGAKIVFCDSRSDHPCIDEGKIKELITTKTKAIVVVHYAGVACDMDEVMDIANENKLFVIEDAAQAIDSYYTGRDGIKKPLGSIGQLAAFSFHETKNIISGEGGMLVVNDERFEKRAEIIWEKGTNRSAFFKGEVDKYGWVDIGSSFLPSEIIAAFLYAQLENLEQIQNKRKVIWNRYYEGLKSLDEQGKLRLANIPEFSSNNAHMFYVVCKSFKERDSLLSFLKKNQISAVFHYLSLHKSAYHLAGNPLVDLPYSDHHSECLIRLPFYYELRENEIDFIISKIEEFYEC
ncbi:MAG: dTDP-4-amino-4,6-dideoxygalactose transaminase [Bacteroidetes bacterium]|nr:dTDP-4-amino-4,6-dideoxygalactose transaminase [Bacteroidota bacterium]